MLERESAYDAIISGAKIQPYSARTLRGSEALARLRNRQYQISSITIGNFEQKDFDERFTFEKNGTGSSSTGYDEKHVAPDAGLEDIKAKLDSLCCEECTAFVRTSEEVADGERYREAAAALYADESGMDTSILHRIKNGESPHHEAFDDLLAPLRSQPLLLGTEESQEDMLDVLLAWNKRVADDRNEGLTARQTFIAALTERVRAVDKVLAIVSDNTNSNQNDETSQDSILEPSQRRLLKAIHTYQPETRTFKNQDPFDMLVVILAHMEAFDIADKDDCVYLTFKVLSGQDQLEHRFIYEKRRRVYEKKEADAQGVDDRDGIRRSKTKWRAYNKKMAERARRRLMARIQCTRNEVRKVGIEELLKLAVLRTAQPRLDREAPPDVYTPSWEKILHKCAQADDYDTLNDELGKHFPDLEAKLEVTASNARDMKTAQDMILFPGGKARWC
jgi:hypothetical protein